MIEKKYCGGGILYENRTFTNCGIENLYSKDEDI